MRSQCASHCAVTAFSLASQCVLNSLLYLQEVQLPEMPRVRPHLLYLTEAQECKGRADWDIDTSLGMPALRAQLAAAVQVQRTSSRWTVHRQ